MELLDDLCDKMQDYTLQKVENEAIRLFKNSVTAHYHLIEATFFKILDMCSDRYHACLSSCPFSVELAICSV